MRRSRRQDEAGIVLVKLQQLVLVLRQAEEIGLLLRPFHGRPLRPKPHPIRAEHGFAFGVKGFVADGVPALIAVEIDVARLLHAPPDFAHKLEMARLARRDEIVVADLKRRQHVLELRRVLVRQLIGRDAELGRGLLHLEAVRIDAGHEIHRVAVEPLETGERIGRHGLIGMADMRLGVGIGDGRANCKMRFCFGFCHIAFGGESGARK